MKPERMLYSKRYENLLVFYRIVVFSIPFSEMYFEGINNKYFFIREKSKADYK